MHIFVVACEGWSPFDPNTSFSQCFLDEFDGEGTLSLLASGWWCLSKEEEAATIDLVEGFPSKRLDEPVKALNLGTLFAVSSSAEEYISKPDFTNS